MMLPGSEAKGPRLQKIIGVIAEKYSSALSSLLLLGCAGLIGIPVGYQRKKYGR